MPKIKAPIDDERPVPATKPTPAKIEAVLKQLRAIVEDPERNPFEQRIAQAEEFAIMWATMETADWPDPDQDAIAMAKILQSEVDGKPL